MTDDFDEHRKELFRNKSRRIALSYLKKAENINGMFNEMKSFFNVLKNIFVDFEDIKRKKEAKLIGSYCAMVPEELIYAAKGQPVRMCSGSYTAYSIGDEYAPRDACPLVKSVMGFNNINTMPMYDNCSLLIVPVSCDCKKKIAGLLMKNKNVFILSMPPSKTDDYYMNEFIKQLYKLIPVIEEETGNEITEKSLFEAIQLTGYAQYELSRFNSLKRKAPLLFNGSQVMSVMNAYAYMNAGEWGEQLKKLNDEAEKYLKNKEFSAKENYPRILITGSPIVFPNIKIPLLIEETGSHLTADETCMGERSLYDPAIIIENSFDSMLRGIANRYIKPCTCPVFGNNTQRIFKIKQMIKDYGIQGVIYHVLRGCLVYDYEYQLIENELSKINIPVIRVESDYSEEDTEQIRIRLEAFTEIIKMRNLKKAGRE